MKNGILTMHEASYRASEGVSKSDLDWIAPPRTPSHYKARKDGLVETEQTPAMRIGSMVHRAILEPDTLAGAWVIKPEGMNFSTKEGKAWRAEQTLPIITAEEAATISGMRDSVHGHPLAKQILAGAKTEQCLFAEDQHGMIRKARLDALVGGNLVPDLKTSASADATEFEKSLGKFRYHVQAAYYLDICNLLGIEKTEFVFIVVEKEPPYACAVYSLDQEAINLGRLEYQRDLALLRSCLESDKWPAFDTECKVIGLPAWMQKQAEAFL